MPEVIIHTADRDMRVRARKGESLAEVILSAGIVLDRPCAGRGTCGKCRVEIRGEAPSLTEAEKKLLSTKEIKNRVRLACQVKVLDDLEVRVQEGVVHTDKIFGAQLDTASLPGELGLAIDLGTTTVGAFLVTLEECRVHAGFAVLNQQISYGAEIISRLAAADRGEQEELKSLARESIRDAISGLKLDKEARSRVKRAVIVGNTAMHHLALALPVHSLVKLPFQPYKSGESFADKGYLGGEFPDDLTVRFAPLIGGFVGSDALACALYFGFDHEPEPAVAVDLGTNGEIIFTDGKNIKVASTAAGPAFEGVNISCGMRALPGAITKAYPGKNGDFRLETIENAEPRGITGSGLLSLIALFVGTGRIDKSGRIRNENGEGADRIDVSPGVYLSQQDVREVQKAKGAIRSAMDTLLEQQGVKPDELSRLVLTGSFGGRVDVDDALSLGIIPPVSVETVRSISNGAGIGAALMLKDENFERACKIAERAEHIELNADEEFMDRYVSSMELA